MKCKRWKMKKGEYNYEIMKMCKGRNKRNENKKKERNEM